MKSTFENRKCPKCGGEHLAHVADWYSGTIPVGITGRIGCQDCYYWESLVSVQESDDVFDTTQWVVLEAGQGKYSSEAERQATITYRNPEADKYARFGIT
jgi:ribosomal protein S27AE